MFSTGKTVGLAEWIIDDTCLVTTLFFKRFVKVLPLEAKVRNLLSVKDPKKS